MLDLLLITEEAQTAEYNKYNAQYLHSYRALFRQLNCSAADAEAVKRKYGLEHYLVDMAGRDLFGMKITESEHLPIFPHRPSLGACDLATAARAAGYETAIVDNVLRYPFRRAQMLRLLETEKPRLVGISTTHIYPDAIKRLVATVREAAPEAKVVLGGPVARRERGLHELADFVVFGAGEEPLVGILRALDGERPIDSIPSIAFRDEAGQVRHSAAARAIMQIGKPHRVRGERIPVADWTLYARGPDNVFPLECSRGCKYNCRYCSYDRGKNLRPLEDIADELRRNAALGIRKYRIGDSNFTDGPPSCSDFPRQVCRMMKALDLDLQWSCFSRADDLTPELAECMRDAGCFAVFLGIETGDDDLMRDMRKGHDVADARRGIEVAKQAGLHTHANFIIGYPGETVTTARRTIDFILETRPDTVTLGQFYLEDYAPIRGPRMASSGLEGTGNRWRHATMDSDTANVLITQAQNDLAAASISLGSEFALVERMSLGLSFEECKRQYGLSKTLLSPSPAAQSKERARDELRKLYLDVMPAAIAKEQRILARAF